MGRRSASPRRRSASRSQSKNRRERSRSRSRSGSKKRRSRSPSRSHERDRGAAGGGGGDRNVRNRGSRSRSRSRSRERNDNPRRSRSRSPRGRDFRGGGGAPGRYGGDRGGGGGRPQPQSLLVRNLSPNTTPERLRRAFSRREGDIRDVYLPKDYSTNQPRGFAFIEFNDSRDAREIKYQMDRTTFEGREIAVLFAQQRRKTPEEMREAPPSPRRNSRSHSNSRRRFNCSCFEELDEDGIMTIVLVVLLVLAAIVRVTDVAVAIDSEGTNVLGKTYDEGDVGERLTLRSFSMQDDQEQKDKE